VRNRGLKPALPGIYCSLAFPWPLALGPWPSLMRKHWGLRYRKAQHGCATTGKDGGAGAAGTG
jgi:hypothetical protein